MSKLQYVKTMGRSFRFTALNSVTKNLENRLGFLLLSGVQDLEKLAGYCEANILFSEITTGNHVSQLAQRQSRRGHGYPNVAKAGPHSVGTFPCSMCDKVFASKGSRHTHFGAIHNKNTFICDCGKMFNYKHVLNRHRDGCFVRRSQT